MNRLAIALIAMAAMLLAGLPAFYAEATTVSGVGFGVKNHSWIVLEAGCRRNGPAVGQYGCPRGTHRVCTKKTGCWCADCPTGD
jgi:hypothetical protein